MNASHKTRTLSMTCAALVGLTLTTAASASPITDFYNFSESGNLNDSFTIEQQFASTDLKSADVAISHESGKFVGWEVFLSDEFSPLAFGDRISVDWDGGGSEPAANPNEAFGLAIASVEEPNSTVDLLTWSWEPGGGTPVLIKNFNSDGELGQNRPALSGPPDTLFIEKTESGWTFGSIADGQETLHVQDATSVGGKDITADGTAVGLWSDMRTSTTPPPYSPTKTLSNFTVVPEPATLALLGLGGAVMLSGRKRRA